MARLELEIHGYNTAFDRMTINGKEQKIKKNKDGTRTCIADIDTKEAEVVISKGHYYSDKLWWLWNSLYFIISLFGIFDIKLNSRFLVNNTKFKVGINGDTKVVLRVRDFEDGGKFLDIESEAKIEETANTYYYDKEASIKHKKMKKIKIGIILGMAILVVLFILI